MREYLLCEKIGSGGMGEVFRAIHRPTGQERALKILQRHVMRQNDGLSRFGREILTLQKLEHPGLIKILDFGCLRDQVYYSMELVEGMTLKESHDRYPYGLRIRSDAIIHGLLEALQVVHRAGIVHRDIKAGNVMIRRDRSLVLMDFGLVTSASTEATALTEPGVVMGTPSYTAPEVLLGHRASLASDMWAVGCLYYFLLTGETPYVRDTLPETLRAIISDPIPDLDALPAPMDEPRKQFLARLLSPDPEDRYADAGTALKRFMAITRRRPTSERPSRRQVMVLPNLSQRIPRLEATVGARAGVNRALRGLCRTLLMGLLFLVPLLALVNGA